MTLFSESSEEKKRRELASEIIKQITPLISGMRSWDIDLLIKEVQNQFAAMLAFVTFPYPSPKIPEDTCQSVNSEYVPNLKELHQELLSEISPSLLSQE